VESGPSRLGLFVPTAEDTLVLRRHPRFLTLLERYLRSISWRRSAPFSSFFPVCDRSGTGCRSIDSTFARILPIQYVRPEPARFLSSLPLLVFQTAAALSLAVLCSLGRYLGDRSFFSRCP